MTEVMPEVVVCNDCDSPLDGDRVEMSEYNLTSGEYVDVLYCTDCRQGCDSCGEVRRAYEVRYVDEIDEWRCDYCMAICEECDAYVLRTDERYSRRYGGYLCDEHMVAAGDEIQPYGHTQGTIWLRMPHEPGRRSDPERYYLGWELEIGTNSQTVKPIRDWAEEHFGRRDAIVGKEDSSVSGFEVVSQPMTPEFFESQDWESFFDMLNSHYPLTAIGEYDVEPRHHGLHVHIGRVAFGKDDIMIAAYAYLLSQSDQLERIGRRAATEYCQKVRNPVKVAISVSGKTDVQARRIKAMGLYPGRDAINLSNEATIEIRAFKSTRRADEFKAAVRATYVAAEYVRSLRESRIGLGKNALHWDTFMEWVKVNHPEAHASLKK